LEAFWAALIAGIGAGGVYALLACGIVVAFRGSGVINFGHGAIAGYAAFNFDELREPGRGNIYLPWVDPIPEWGVFQKLGISNVPVRVHIMEDPPTWLAVVMVLLVSALIGVMMHFLVFRPLRNAPTLAKVIGSLGVFIYLGAVGLRNFGNSTRNDPGWWKFDSTSDAKTVWFTDKTMPGSNFWLMVTALVVGGLLWAFFRYSRFGIATRAADENEKGAALLGYSPQLLAGLNWVLSSVLAGIAGIVFLHKTQPGQFALLVVFALAAALIGNLTSVMGATLGGLGLGMVASAGVNFFQRDFWGETGKLWLPADGVRQFVPLITIILVLYLRGDKLPVRGSISAGRQPRAPSSNNVTIGAMGLVGIGFLVSNIFVSKWESALSTSLIFMLFMFSLVVLVGYLGQISLAQWSLAGVAAWSMARLVADGLKIREFDFFVKDGPNWPMLLACVAGVAAAVIVGVLVGLPALRIRGVQLTVVTLAAVVAIEKLVLRNPGLMGEGADSSNPLPELSIFGKNFGGFNENSNQTDNWRYTVFLIVLVAIVGVLVANLRRGVIGRRFLAVRANERAAAAAGIDVSQTKLLGFAISSGIAGISGVLFAFKLSSLTSEQFSPILGLTLLAFVYLGGITTVTGAVIGGLLVAGGLNAEILGLHFESVDRTMISIAGGALLIVNAIATNGEGISLVNATTGKEIIAGLRRGPTPDEEPVVDLSDGKLKKEVAR
jgi:branched-chain amino acid transport system permease protein